MRGEGVFLHFSEKAIEAWIKKTDARDTEFLEAHRRWRTTRGHRTPTTDYPTMRYVLLHSLAHALIRQFSLECGYTTASIRERIYSRPPGGDREAMAGVLLYTAAPDSEGTLGGLVSLGEPKSLGRHLDQALEAMRLCTSDPLCAEHHPYRDSLTLHGAACHACLFLPETSCERGNKYLDRSVLVSTVESADLAFFKDFAEAMPKAEITAHTDEGASTAQAGENGTDRDRRTGGLLRRAVQGVRALVGREKLPLPVVGFELQDERVGSAPKRNWHGPRRRSPPSCPKGPTPGQTSRSRDGRSWTPRTLTDQEPKLRELLGA